MSNFRHQWAVWAIVLGTWEAGAVLTRRFPTVSQAMWCLHRRHRHLARALTVAWCVGLSRHLWQDSQ